MNKTNFPIPVVDYFMFWDFIKTLDQGYEYTIGLLIFTQIAVLAWVPFVREFQSQLLFSQAFSTGLQISRIFAGERSGSDD